MPNTELKSYIVIMPDGSRWSVPVMVIAVHRANFYKHEHNDDVYESLEKGTIPWINKGNASLWAMDQMTWDDVKDYAIMITPPSIDYNEGWKRGGCVSPERV